MGTLRYGMNVSLDGYIEDPEGSFAFSEPDNDVHRLANDHARETSAFLFGRRLYEVMEDFWVDAAGRTDLPDVEAEFAQAYVSTPRIVFSDTLTSASPGVRLVRSTDALAECRRLKNQTDGLLDLGGAGLAASLLDLIDEFRLFVVPVVVGGGKPFLPTRGERLQLRLREHRVFASGTVYLRYERAR